MSRAWVAGPDEAGAVAALMAQFRDHLGASEPSDASVLRSVERIVAEPDSEFLLAGDGSAAAVLQLRFRWSVWKDAPDAWIDHEKTQVGYEIPFNRHFYVFTPPRPLSEIDAELKTVTDRIVAIIGGLSS